MRSSRLRNFFSLILFGFLIFYWWTQNQNKNLINSANLDVLSDQSDLMARKSSTRMTQKNPEKNIKKIISVSEQKVPVLTAAKMRVNILNEPGKRGDSGQKIPRVCFTVYNKMAIAYGDVLLGHVEENIPEGNTDFPKILKWPSPILYYHIQPQLDHPERILQALQYLSTNTVLQFLPYRPGVADALVFETMEQHCLSYVGRVGGLQPIFISNDCSWQNIVHEVLHAVGFFHEHSRSDRDQFIQIQWENIPMAFRSQFDILPDEVEQPWLKYPYDIKSIMHYSTQYFTDNGARPSLTSVNRENIPEPEGLSHLDIQRINDLFTK